MTAAPNIRDSSSIGYVQGLDGIRAIAIVAVMLFHFTAPFAPGLRAAGGGWNVAARASAFGWVGVDVFFVVSGFLIARILSARPVRSRGDYARFLARRAWRLVPAYAACLAVVTAAALLVDPGSKVLRNEWMLWTLTENIVGSFGDRAPVTDGRFSLVHFWSLCVEWHFYLLFPLALAWAGSTLRAAGVLIGMAIVTRAVLFAAGASDNATYGFTFSRIDSIALGCALAAVAESIPWRAIRPAALGGLAAFVAIGVAVAAADPGTSFKASPWMQLAGYSAIALCVAAMLAAVIRTPPARWPVRGLEHPLVAFLGRASYGIYLWHLAFFPSIYAAVSSRVAPVQAAYLATLVASCAFSLAAGIASYALIEVPSVRVRILPPRNPLNPRTDGAARSSPRGPHRWR